MGDNLRIALWAGAAAVVLAAVCLGYLVSQNLGSRNIALATGALAGAAILLGIQLLFELRADESTDFITAEYTIDRAKPEIRQWRYGSNQALRMGRELDASGKFAAAHRGQFNGGGAELLLRPNAIPTRLRRRDKLRPHPRHGNGHSAAEKYGGNRQRNPRVARAAALQHRLARPMGGEASMLNKILLAAIALGLWANAVIMVIRPTRADDGSYSYLGEIAQAVNGINNKLAANH